MRAEFVSALEHQLEKDKTQLLISGDLGFRAFEGIVEKFPRQFLNAGVAEQNMVGAAAGMAFTGLKPWVYSIAPFLVYRAFEQIRNDVCFHQLPVKLVGNGGGFTYGIMGSSHHALEDLGVLKTLPGLQLFFPCIARRQVTQAVNAMANLAGPSYLRLGITPFQSDKKPLDAHPLTMTTRWSFGGDVTVIAVGQALQAVLEAGVLHRAEVFGISRYPFDRYTDEAVLRSAFRTRAALIVEEHRLAGSIGESLALEIPRGTKLEVSGFDRELPQKYGSAAFHMADMPRIINESVGRLRGETTGGSWSS